MAAINLDSARYTRQAADRAAASTEPESERPGRAPAGEATQADATFQPLDPGIVSAAIPAFFIGRNREGFWLARDVKGETGGIFLFESSALSFARMHSRPAGCATIFPAERFELDLENRGNPFIAQLGPAMRFMTRARRRLTTVIGRMIEMAERRSKGVQHPMD